MKFYHGTSQSAWQQIQNEGILFGDRGTRGRCTYLAAEIEEAKCYGEVVLEVDYDPLKNVKANNYIEGCWQFRVYEPIPISQIKEIEQ